MAPCYQALVHLSGTNLTYSSPRVEACLQLFGRVVVQRDVHSKYFFPNFYVSLTSTGKYCTKLCSYSH
jgi:hypothetical protein